MSSTMARPSAGCNHSIPVDGSLLNAAAVMVGADDVCQNPAGAVTKRDPPNNVATNPTAAMTSTKSYLRPIEPSFLPRLIRRTAPRQGTVAPESEPHDFSAIFP